VPGAIRMCTSATPPVITGRHPARATGCLADRRDDAAGYACVGAGGPPDSVQPRFVKTGMKR
jgi:hypothetical protein